MTSPTPMVRSRAPAPLPAPAPAPATFPRRRRPPVGQPPPPEHDHAPQAVFPSKCPACRVDFRVLPGVPDEGLHPVPPHVLRVARVVAAFSSVPGGAPATAALVARSLGMTEKAAQVALRRAWEMGLVVREPVRASAHSGGRLYAYAAGRALEAYGAAAAGGAGVAEGKQR